MSSKLYPIITSLLFMLAIAVLAVNAIVWAINVFYPVGYSVDTYLAVVVFLATLRFIK